MVGRERKKPDPYLGSYSKVNLRYIMSIYQVNDNASRRYIEEYFLDL